MLFSNAKLAVTSLETRFSLFLTLAVTMSDWPSVTRVGWLPLFSVLGTHHAFFQAAANSNS